MHDSVKKESRTRRKADGKRMSSEGTDGEMNNFQDLQLGSMAPVVRPEERLVLTFSPDHSLAGHEQVFCALIKFDPQYGCPMRRDPGIMLAYPRN